MKEQDKTGKEPNWRESIKQEEREPRHPSKPDPGKEGNFQEEREKRNPPIKNK